MSGEKCHLSAEAGVSGLAGAELRELLETLLREVEACRMRVNGTSMNPVIRSGDLAGIKPAGLPVRLGDVVVAGDTGGGRVLVHRAVRRRLVEGRAEYLLMGDSGCDSGDWVPERNVLGIVEWVERGGRRRRMRGGLPGCVSGWLTRRLCKLARWKHS